MRKCSPPQKQPLATVAVSSPDPEADDDADIAWIAVCVVGP